MTLQLSKNKNEYILLSVVVRVVSSQISGEKFPEIYSNFSGNLSKIFHFICSIIICFLSPALQIDAVKSTFLTKALVYLCALC